MPSSSLTFSHDIKGIQSNTIKHQSLVLMRLYLGWRQEFSDEGMALPTRGLKYGFHSTLLVRNLQKSRFSPSDGS